MNDFTPSVRRPRPDRPEDIQTMMFLIDDRLYRVRRGYTSFVISRQCMVTVPGKGQVPYWRVVTNRDEIVKVLKAI